MQIRHVVFGIASTFVAVACGQSKAPTSQTDTVVIPQTGVKDQKQVGFCWAYATVAHLESIYKSKTTQEIKLSPEAIGFYRMAAGLYDLTRHNQPNAVLTQLTTDDLEGYIVEDNNKTLRLGDAFQIIETYGVVPETAWAYKFTTHEQVQALVLNIKAALVKLVWSKVLQGHDASAITPDEIVQKVMTVRGAYPSAPPSSFDFNGRTITGLQLLHDEIGFHSSNYKDIEVQTDADLPKFLRAIKLTLARGLDPLIGFPVIDPMLKANDFTADGVDVNDSAKFTPIGFHEVVITDFVNIGGKEGEMPAEQVNTEMAKGWDQLQYLVVKNSWGMVARYNDKGEVIAGSPTGYYKIERDYITGSAKAMHPAFDIVVPTDIADSL